MASSKINTNQKKGSKSGKEKYFLLKLWHEEYCPARAKTGIFSLKKDENLRKLRV